MSEFRAKGLVESVSPSSAERQHDRIGDSEQIPKRPQEMRKGYLTSYPYQCGGAVAILAFIGTLASRTGITLAKLESQTAACIGFRVGIISQGLRALLI